MSKHSNVIQITRTGTPEWRAYVAAEVNKIRRRQMFRQYAYAMQEVFFCAVGFNITLLGVYTAMLGDFVSQAQKID